MESANLHHQHHQLQDQLALASSSLVNPSCYGVAASSHSWTPTVSLTSTDNFSPSFNGAILNSRQTSNSMIQDLGLQWTTNAVAGSFTTQPADDLQLAKIKQELSGSFPKFTEMLTSSSSSCIEDTHLTTSSYLKNDHKNLDELSQKLLLKTISSGFPINNGHQFSAGEFLSESHNCTSGFGRAVPGRSGSFSQIYPSINISNLNQSSSSISSSFDMNLQALEGRFSGHFNQSSRNLFGTVYKDSLPFGLGHFQQSSSCRPSCSPSRISSFANETAEAKRSSSLVEPKAATDQAAPPKKSRLDSRAPCPPFKVRKEKLGDRIAALQQLVAPFGKTDTASVLMEAIGYIKFLQSQVETLSVPYMKSSRNKIGRTTQGGSGEDGKEEPKRDLRSRGLCLVPLSCMSYVTGDAGGGIWPPHCFGDGT